MAAPATMAVRAVLFDAVGTLIYPDPPVADAYYAAGQRFGSTRTRQEVGERFHWAFAREDASDAQNDAPGNATSEVREYERWQSIVAHVFDDLPDTSALLATLWQHFAESRHWRLFDDVAETWRELTARGYVLGIASNFDERLDALCDALPPLTACVNRFVSSRLGYRKPSLQFFRAVADALGLPPGQLLLVGDDYKNDYLGARSAGWQSVLLCRREPSAAVPSKCQVRSLSELMLPLQRFETVP
jgi:putative hydrolase of the HAD superfamily